MNSLLSFLPPVREMTLLKHFVFSYGVFRSLYLMKVPFYWGGRFLFVCGFTRNFPIFLPRLQAGLALGTGREERRQKGKWQLAPGWRQVPHYSMGLPTPLEAI